MSRHGIIVPLLGGLWALVSVRAASAPATENSSFEADRYAKWPGYSRQHDGAMTGWRATGGAGVNPIWKDPDNQRGPDSPFHDNGRVPDGKQLAFIQGPGTINQVIDGFERGRRYVVTYRENARVQRQGTAWPRLRVALGGQVIVSPHEVVPVAKRNDFSVPFYRVESGAFAAPGDGRYELIFETIQDSPTTTVMIDDIRIRDATDEAPE